MSAERVATFPGPAAKASSLEAISHTPEAPSLPDLTAQQLQRVINRVNNAFTRLHDRFSEWWYAAPDSPFEDELGGEVVYDLAESGIDSLPHAATANFYLFTSLGTLSP
jgi:hypothetical protein